MPRTHPPYPIEFRNRMIDLIRAGRTPEELAQEFEPTAQTRSCMANQRIIQEWANAVK